MMCSANITTQEVGCPVCGSSDAKPCFYRKDLTFLTSDQQYLVVKCEACGMGYIRNMPTLESLSGVYPASFYTANSSLHIDHQSVKNRRKFIENQSGDLLDIGCAGGEFVHYIRSKGINAVGFDWTTSLESKEHLYYGGTLQEHFSQDACFDTITMWAVLEHAVNLQEVMVNVQRLLKRGGVFIALVTNFDSLPGRYMQQDDVPRHVNFFTAKSMKKLLLQHDLVAQSWNFGNDVFNGTHRGLLVFLAKQLLGERKSDIVAQHRAPGRRDEFCHMLHGKKSRFISALCAVDRRMAPCIDAIAGYVHRGFTMTVLAKKV